MVAVAPLSPAVPRPSLSVSPVPQAPRLRAEDYIPLVRRIAFGIVRGLPAHVEVADLVSTGMIGLLDAIAKYDPQRNANFEAYAELRVRGAIIDELRHVDWIPRSVRARTRSLTRASQALECELGRTPEADEVAARLNLSVDEVHEMRANAHAQTLVSLEKTVGPNGELQLGWAGMVEDNTLEGLCNQVRTAALVQAIDALPERSRLVISLYYYEDMKQKDIGAILGVCESRVCQLMRDAHSALAAAMAHTR